MEKTADQQHTTQGITKKHIINQHTKQTDGLHSDIELLSPKNGLHSDIELLSPKTGKRERAERYAEPANKT